MKVLIVGGAGYIGSHMTDLFLKNHELDITLYDNLLYGKMFFKKITFIYGDIRDSKKLKGIIDDFDVVIWLAAIVGECACAADEDLSIEVNYNAVKWLVDNYTGKIIFMSTCSVYGMNSNLLDENTKPNPLSVYAKTKLMAEDYIKKSRDNYLIFRLGSLYGIGDKVGRLRFDLAINLLTLRAVYGETLTVFGENQCRPILHVRDVAHAVEYCMKNEITGCYNLSERNVVISDLAGKIVEILPNTKVEYRNCGFEDLRDYRVKNNLILSKGWRPMISFEDGISELVEVIQNEWTSIDLSRFLTSMNKNFITQG